MTTETQAISDSRPIDVDAAAAYLGVGVRFVRRLCSERRVRYLRMGGKVRFLPLDLDDFLDAAAVAPAHKERGVVTPSPARLADVAEAARESAHRKF